MRLSSERIVLAAVLLLFAVFCVNAENYKYVDSPEGLRIRDSAALSGNRIGGLVHNQKVVVLETGPEAEIDGIKSNWIKIMLPETQTDSFTKTEGWVFGGYLTDVVPEPVTTYLGAVNGDGSGKGIFDVKQKIQTVIPTSAPAGLPQIVRKDFSGDFSKMVSSVEFGKKLYFRNDDGTMEYFTELPPYTGFQILGQDVPGYYEVKYFDVTCYVMKSDVTAGVVPGFTLKDAPLYEASKGGASLLTLSPRTFILVTGEKDMNRTKVMVQTEGKLKEYYVDQNLIWYNQNDVLALQALRSEEDVLATRDYVEKTSKIITMLEATANYSETNLFQADHLRLAKLWNRYKGYSGVSSNLTAAEMYGSLKALDIAFTTSAYYGIMTYTFTNTIGNYLTNAEPKIYMPAVKKNYPCSRGNTSISYYYDVAAGCILTGKGYLDPDDTVPAKIKAIYQASKEKTAEGIQKCLANVDFGWNTTMVDIILGTDCSSNIKDWNVSLWGSGERSNAPEALKVRKGAGKIELRSLPGTRWPVTGYVYEGSMVQPVKYTCGWIKGYGDSTPYINWVYVRTQKGTEGWVENVYLADPADSNDSGVYETAGNSYSMIETRYGIGVYNGSGSVVVQALNGTKAWLYEDAENNDNRLCQVNNGTELKVLQRYMYNYSDDWESTYSDYDYKVQTADGTVGWLRCEDIYEKTPRYDSWRLK